MPRADKESRDRFYETRPKNFQINYTQSSSKFGQTSAGKKTKKYQSIMSNSLEFSSHFKAMICHNYVHDCKLDYVNKVLSANFGLNGFIKWTPACPFCPKRPSKWLGRTKCPRTHSWQASLVRKGPTYSQLSTVIHWQCHSYLFGS
jgi:hypothetical protein